MSGVTTTIALVGLVVLGAGIGWLRPFPDKLADRAMFLVLFLLLFLMGFSTAHVPDIDLRFSLLGVTAFWGSVLPLLGTWLMHFLWRLVAGARAESAHRSAPEEPQAEGERPCLICVFRLPLILILMAALGFLVGWRTTEVWQFNADLALDVVLYVLVFLVGYGFGYSRRSFLSLLLRWQNLVSPALTVAGSLLAGLLLPPLTGWKLSESLALVSGMGWYSLSAGLINSLGNPLLGSAAFLANLFRETLSLLLIPALLRLRFREGAVGSPGAASMDVALPLLEKFGGVDLVPIALVHGILVTAAVPLLVILWMNLGF